MANLLSVIYLVCGFEDLFKEQNPNGVARHD